MKTINTFRIELTNTQRSIHLVYLMLCTKFIPVTIHTEFGFVFRMRFFDDLNVFELTQRSSNAIEIGVVVLIGNIKKICIDSSQYGRYFRLISLTFSRSFYIHSLPFFTHKKTILNKYKHLDFRFECVHKIYNAMDRFSKLRAFLLFLSLLTKFGVSANVVFGILNSCSCLYYYDILSYLHKYIYLCCMYNWQLFDCFKFESCIPYFQKNITCAKHTFFSWLL